MHWNTNKLTELKKLYADELGKYYDEREATTFVNILIRSFFGLTRADVAVKPDHRLSESEILKFHFAVKDLKKFKPIQYIIKKTDFLNIRLMVNESVLIPRPETEELASLIIGKEKGSKLKVLDIGTGSGCLAIALKKNLNEAEVTGVDISKEALTTAGKNAFINEQFVHFIQADILRPEKTPLSDKYDVIVSNPPYVTLEEKSMMKDNVLRYEPHIALFVKENDPLIFYKAILYFTSDHLSAGGRVYFEVNEKFAGEVAGLYGNNNFKNVEMLKDINGKTRFVTALKI